MHILSRKRRRTALNGIVILAMAANLFLFGTMSTAEEVPPAASASRLVFNDIQGNWAAQAIERWADLGWAKGHEDGSFHPEQEVTRAEFISLANRMYGYTERATIDYLDVTDAWYAKDVEVATAAGYISGYQDHTFRPNEPISRQEAAAMIARLLGLEQSGSKSILKFGDKAAIPSWSQGAVSAVVDQGYMKGYTDGTFRPAQPITRAEAIVALDRTAAMKIVAAGTYGPSDQVDTIHGNVIITSPDVTLQNVRITGNLLLAQSVGEGDVTLTGITVEGSTIVSGGGEHSVHVIDSQLVKVIVDKKAGSVRIVASGSTNIDQTSLKTGAALEMDQATGSGFGDVTIAIDETTGSPIVKLNGNFTSVIVDTPNVSVDLQNGSINELNVSNSAANTKLSVAENANVDTLVLDSNTEVTGEGNVKNAKVNAIGSTFSRKPDKLESAEGVVVEVNDSRAGTTEPAASGNNGGNGSGNNNNGNGNNGNGGGNGNGGSEAVEPAVASVANVADIEVINGTTLAYALSSLATTTTITDNAGATHTVNLIWTIDGYDGNQAGGYTATGTFALPADVVQADPPIPLSVTANVTVKAADVPPVDATATVVSVTDVSDIAVDFGTSEADVLAALATETTITDTAGATHTVNLIWTIDGYDGNQAGGYTATGTFALPADVVQADPPIPLSVTANVTVKAADVPPVDATATVVSVTDVSDIAVDFGTSEADVLAALATETTITDTAGATHTVNLIWTIDGYDGNQAGGYTATGTFALPVGVVQADPPVPLRVTANVTVSDANIVSVDNVTDIAVDFGTSETDVIAALATTTTIMDQTGATHTVNLSWTIDGYDGNQAGVYTATGTFFLPSGVSQADPSVPLNVTANVTVNDPSIVSIADVTDIAVDFGTSDTDAIALLATETTITDQAGATHTVNLSWTIDGYDGNQAGVYTANGTFILPSGVSQPNPPVPLNVTANVTVNDAYIVSVDNAADIAVDFGTSEADVLAALATTTTITDTAGATHTVSLDWTIDGYDGNQAGGYTATGTFALPADVVQADPPVPLRVTANVTVNDANIVSVDNVTDIAVDFGTSETDVIAALATTTTIMDQTGATHTVNLIWTIDGYDGNQAGVYTATGTFFLPSGVSQADPSVPLNVTANVTVNDPSIVSIADVTDIAVDFGTSDTDAIALLATETTITDQAGATHTVNLSWTIDGYDGNQAGAYTATGTFILPSGVSQPNPPVPLNVTANVTVNDAYIVSVDNVTDIAVDFGTSDTDAIAALATTTTITDQAGTTHTVNLDWTIDGYDGVQTGAYTATGTFILPSGVSQPNPPVPLNVTANVTVNDAYIVSVDNAADIAVDFGTSEAAALAALAKTTTVTDNVHATHSVSLSWTIDGYDGNQAGAYTATGTFALPADVVQATPPVPLNVTANVSVNDPSIVSIADVTDIAVDFGTSEAAALAALATTTTITDQTGATHTVNLSWTIDGYDDAQANSYTATGMFNLPTGVSQANPAVQLEVIAEVTVKNFNILSALTSGDASEIVISFEAPLAAPTSPAGLTVTVNGVSDSVVSTTLDADPSKLHIGLAASVPLGTVSVSYEPPGLTTAGGSTLPAFSNLAVPTAGSLAEQLKNEGETLDSIVDTLKVQGYSLVVVVQALQANDYNVDETAAALKTAQVPADSAAAGLLYAGYPVADVAAALKQVYLADSTTVAAAVLPLAGTADELVAALASAGFTQPSELAQALYATNFTVTEAAAALWSRFSGAPGQLGSALTGAGYSLSDAVAAVLALNGGNNTAAVAAAWPGMFGESGALAPVETAAANLQSANLTVSETNALLIALYPTYKTDPNLRASALKTGGYDATDVARILESDFYQTTKPGSDVAITNVLNGNGYSPLLIAQAIQTVFGYDAAALATNVFSQMGFNTLDTLQMLQQAGFGDNDVARAAIALMPGSIKQISPFLHVAGYTAEQVIAMLKSALIQDGSFNVTGVTAALSSVTFIDDQAAGYYSTAEIASVLQKVFGSTAETVGVEILKLGNVYDLQGVALALQSLYAIDGFEFIEIRNAAYTAAHRGLTSDLADNGGRTSGEWRLLYILQNTFGMDAAEALAGLRDAARSGSISTVMNKLQSIYGSMTVAQKIEAMTQAGFNLAEIAGIVGSGQTLAAMVGYLHDAGYSAEAVAQYLLDVLNANDVTTASNLMSAGYGSCANLEPIIVAIKQVYQSDDAQLLDILTAPGRDCTSTQVSTVLAAMGSSVDFPQYAATDLYTKGAPATQAVSLLQQVYAKSDVMEIASILKQAGYNSHLTMTALRSMMGLSPSDAKSMLASLFGITEDGAVTSAMKEAGYSVADIVSLLGTTDPFVLMGYLQAANVHAMDALIQLYGPGGAINDPLTLSKNLKALGVDRVPATAIMQSYGYSPAEIGSLLWSNGYDLPEVAAGVNQALAPVANEFWMTTMAKALKQMTTCTGGILADLPTCSTGNSTFTYAQVIEAIAASLGSQTLDCSTGVAQCSIVLETMRNAGYSVPTVAGTLYTDFHLSLGSLSALLQNTDGYATPEPIADLLQQAPFHASVIEIAKALHHTTFSMRDIHDGLMDVAGGEEAAFRAMKDGDYSILELTRAMGSYGVDRSKITNNLQAIGYSHTEALNAVLALYPISVEEWMGIIMDAAGSW